MRTCEEIRALLSALLDGELPEAERREAEAHLAGCPECRAYLADLTAMRDALRALDDKAPEGFSRRVMEEVRGTQQERPVRKVVDLRRWRRWAAAAACCAVMAAGAFFLWRGGAEEAGGDGVMMARSAGPDVAVYDAETDMDAPDSCALEKGYALPADGILEDAAGTLTLTTGSEAAGAWVEEHLGLAWTAGAVYELTAEQYASLRQALVDAGADFREAEEGETYRLIAQ